MTCSAKCLPALVKVARVCLLCGGLVFTSPARADHKPKHDPGGGGGDGKTAAPYTLTDLGGFGGGDFVQSDAVAINNLDEAGLVMIVGDSFKWPEEEFHASVWDATAAGDVDALTEIPPLPGAAEYTATAVNDAGIVVGRTTVSGMQDEDGFYKFPAFIAVPGQPVAALPSLDSKQRDRALGISNTGYVVGTSVVVEEFVDENDEVQMDLDGRGALWHVEADGSVTGPLDLGKFGPRDVNDSGLMAGSKDGVAAIAWFDADGILQVEKLGVLFPDDVGSRARAVNDSGTVVGWSRPGPNKSGNPLERAFRWTPEAGMQPLGVLDGQRGSRARDINDAGQIVGDSPGDPSTKAFLWQDGEMFDLNDLDDSRFDLLLARGINEEGRIVGLGRTKRRKGETHGFLLTPTTP